MFKLPLYLLLLFPLLSFSQSERFKNKKYLTPQEISSNHSAHYFEMIRYYEMLDKEFEEAKFFHWDDGTKQSDQGYGFHLLTLSNKTSKRGKRKIKKENICNYNGVNTDKPNILIINGIHPGEPEGIDASMRLARDLVNIKIKNKLLENVNIYIIPVFNIEGMMNRNAFSRANQNGPDSMGFRGNAQNLDLNRDFIKMDSKNTRALVEIIQEIEPDIIIDNHTSNGADYQYTLTYLDNLLQINKPELKNLNSEIAKNCQQEGVELFPYVDMISLTPDSGIARAYYSPRFSGGYVGLFGVPCYTVETHMLKPFPDRVNANYVFMESLIKTVNDWKSGFPKNFDGQFVPKTDREIDSSKLTKILFKGYEATYPISELSAEKRLKYNKRYPYEKTITYLNKWKDPLDQLLPDYYLIPTSQERVLKNLQLNGVEIVEFDSVRNLFFKSQKYYKDRILNYKTLGNLPYEGHYPHTEVKCNREQVTDFNFKKGEFQLIELSTEENNKRSGFIHYVLNPKNKDSYFSWNFFDSYLQQKEYYSPYVFEDLAVEVLRKNPQIKKEFEQEKQKNNAFRDNGKAQLEWVYKHSKYFEPSLNLLPIMYGYWMK